MLARLLQELSEFVGYFAIGNDLQGALVKDKSASLDRQEFA